MMRKIIIFKLRVLARLILAKYKPVVVAVTGSVGKTSAKDAIATVFSRRLDVRKSEKNLNTAIGVPLVVIGGVEAGRNLGLWFKNIFRALGLILFRQKYPQVLVVELGADRPGDIEYFSKWIKPHIAVVTAIGDVPVHVEFYSGPEEVAIEKAKILRPLTAGDFAVLNFDDLAVYEMNKKTKAKVITYGFGDPSASLGASGNPDVKISDYRLRVGEEGDTEIPAGIGFKLEYAGGFIPVRLQNCYGKSNAYAAAAAAAAGIASGLNLVEISDALFEYHPPKGRMELKRGIKNTWLMDDSYNASPQSMRMALETLRDFPGERKLAVLGDMRELGKFAFEAHQAMGYLAAAVCDYIFTLGDHGKVLGEAALEKGYPQDKVFHFDDAKLASDAVKKILEPGDLILIKGSRVLGMEKIVNDLVVNPIINK